MSFNANVSSVQDVIRDGEKLDIYYYSKQNLFIQSRPTIRNNKFFQQLTSPNSGTSQFIFSPDQGLTDVILVVKLNKQGEAGCDYTNFALSRGWMNSLLSNLAVRYGGSSQYFFNSSQVALQNAMDMQDAPSRDTLWRLAGDALMGNNPLNNGANDFAVNNYGYLYLNLPHNTPNGDGLKMSPLPSELLRQPILIQVNLNDSRTIFSSSSSATSYLMNAPVVSQAFFQCVQVRMVDSANLLTNEEDPNKITYVYPLKYFPQQLVSQSIGVQTAGQNNNVNITGFRNGSVRSIILWLSDDADTAVPAGTARAFNDNNWYAPIESQLSINGEIFDVSVGGSSQLLNLVNNKQASELAETQYTLVDGVLTPVIGGFTATYLKVDFSQHSDPVTSSNLLVGGKSITNSIVNFQFQCPYKAGASWRLNWISLYNSSLIFSQGNCEFSF
jgi:hypothetical protein